MIVSIAYAVSLCFDQQPGELIFDQNLMRHHLLYLLVFSYSTTVYYVSSTKQTKKKSKDTKYRECECFLHL